MQYKFGKKITDLLYIKDYYDGHRILFYFLAITIEYLLTEAFAL